MKHQGFARNVVAAGLGLTMALAGLAPAVALAESTSTTNLYVEGQQDGITTPEGSADANIKVVLPVAINYVADAEGNLTGPSDGTVTIQNNTELGTVHVSKIHVVPQTGVTLVEKAAQATEDDSVYLQIRPGNKETVSLYKYLQEQAPTAGNWDVAQKGTLALNNLTGKIGGFNKLDPASKEKVAAIHWTVAPGSAEQAATAASSLTIHLINADNSLDDLVVNKSNPEGTLPSGYSWKTASNTAIESVAAAVTAAGSASELNLYGTAQ